MERERNNCGSSEDLCIRRIPGDGDLKQALKLREIVFIDEQNVSLEAEFDGLDDQCDHLIASIGPRTVGTLRIRLINDHLAKIERVAVLKKRTRTTSRCKADESSTPAPGLILVFEPSKFTRRPMPKKFYGRLGFVAGGDIFDEDGIPHIAMNKSLP